MYLCKDPTYSQAYAKNKGVERYKRVTDTNQYSYPDKVKILDKDSPSRLATPNYCTTNNQCTNTDTYTYLNKRGVEPSPFFEKTEKGEYRSTVPDDRLYDTSRNHNMTLDIPPIQVFYDLKRDNISGKANNDYGRNYKDYASVTGGQIQYYVDKDIADPFFSPVYGMPTNASAYVCKDPMGTTKVEFEKAFDNSRRKHTNMLSSIEDTTKHRDDIIAHQQRTHNERRYDLIYNATH
jgi:hypothetical protein